MTDQRQQWEDGINNGIQQGHNLLELLKRERNQLYGTIEHIMKMFETTEMVLPPLDEFNKLGREYYVVFEQASDDPDLFRVKLVKRTPDENQILD